MIPVRLYMRNFMCYREQTLDLRGIHLASLTGSNGHGKSAILDAMTWSLWGYSRLGARRDDELIRLGQSEMEVAFEFALLDQSSTAGQNDQTPLRYRVTRKRSKQGRGRSSLDLHGWDPTEERFRSLGASTISKTQDRIDDLLRMDYDTFINASFLLQGRADEFTIKRPAERKRVLGDILGLQIYDRYQERAKEAARRHQTRAEQLVAAVEQIDRELAREDEYRADVERAEAELAHIEAERAATEQEYEQIRRRLQEAEQAQQQLGQIEQRREATRQELARLAREREAHQARLAALEEALAQQSEIEAGYAALQEAMAESEAMTAKLAQSASLKEERSALQRQIDAARHELDAERRAARAQLAQRQEAANCDDQQQEWQEIRAALQRLDRRVEEKEQAQAAIHDLRATIAALQAGNKRAEEDALQLKEKIELLSGSKGDAARCPLCGQPLAESNCAALLNDFQAQIKAEREAYRQRNIQINEALARSKALQDQIAGIDRELRQRTAWQRREAALQHSLDQAAHARQALPEARQRVQAIERRLAEKDDAPQARAALNEVEQQLGELGYDADAHRQLQARLDELRPFEEQMQTLREAGSGLETVRLAMAQIEAARAQAVQRDEADQAQAQDLHAAAGHLAEFRQQSIQARRVLESAHDREQQANLRLGAARNKVEYCADLKRQRVKRLKEKAQHRQEQALYQELHRAFGKQGIQAMLIESAIPDIEREANHLLARMTAGRMHVRFETQRDTKAGKTLETLDIDITDEVGTRSYETYSGGERYRINFAIRIALSKLLARRAGAQLQMLVIDEGFGTQDDAGREGIIDAINAVRDDFACILVITHIQELKEAFTVQIEVQKTDRGSEITIVS